MFGLFKKKESEKFWSDYSEHGLCSECDHLQGGSTVKDICPKCGSREVKKVVASFQRYFQSRGPVCRMVTCGRRIRGKEE